MQKRLGRARALSVNLQRKLESFGKVLNANILGTETKLSRHEMCISTRNNDVENLKQEKAHLKEVVRVVRENIKMIS